MKGFTDEERDRIREELHRAGRELFTRFGLERTRIEDLTDEVGIGTSTFYQFFDSKEALYLSILVEERERVAAELAAELEAAPDVRAEVRLTIEHFLEELSSNPLYYRLLIEDEIRTLHGQLSEEIVAEHHREAMAAHDDHVHRWGSDPAFRADDAERLQGLFRLLGFTIAAREELFEPAGAVDLYESSQDLLVDVVVDGLFVEE
jgi:AcrR family transcriptional regulator